MAGEGGALPSPRPASKESRLPKNWLGAAEVPRPAAGLAPLEEAVQHLIALLCQPVPGHGGHAPDENGGEDHVALGGERRQRADDDAEEHLLQDQHLLVRYVVKQALLRPGWGHDGEKCQP